ncbi:hypothetical protein NL676_023186 [Syzygium grande]|nr:hypothetical protein NL676_023186 [Syzygium grande]
MEIAQLSFAADCPPLSAIAAAGLAGVPLHLDPSLPPGSPPFLLCSDGHKLHGAPDLLRHIASVSKTQGLYGSSVSESSEVDKWLDYAPILSSGSEFENACKYLDEYLEKSTFLVGHSLTVADIAIWSGLAGVGLRWESLRKSKKYQNLVRWFNSIYSEYNDILDAIIATYVGKKGSGKAATGKQGSSNQSRSVNGDVSDKGKGINKSSAEVDLPDAEFGKVCLRFAPEPSGYLHIGHSKAALMNQYFAQRYQGKVIVRFDDTNPAKESNEFVDNILKDIETLGVKYDRVTYTSDYFPELMEMAEKVIREGKAYVDDTPRGGNAENADGWRGIKM